MAAIVLPDNSQSILLIGKNGSGKTIAAVWHLSQRDLANERFVVINHKREPLINAIPGAHFLAMDERPKEDTGVYIYQPRPVIDDDAVEDVLWWIYETENTGLYLDEGYMVSPRSPALNSIYTQGRSKKIPVITLSQRPSRISRFAVSEAMFIQVFLLTDRRDRKTIGEFMPVDMDDFMVPKDGQPRILAPYHSLYYDTRDDAPVVLRPVPSADEILETLAEKLLTPEERQQFVDGAFNPDTPNPSSEIPRENEADKPVSRLRLI